MKMKKVLLMGILAVSLLTACKKDDPATEFNAGAFYSANLFGRSVVISNAIDNNNSNVTTNFASYTFRFERVGTVTASNSLFSIPGTWTATSDSTKITIAITGGPTELGFLNRQWTLNVRTAPPVQFATNDGGVFRSVDFR